MQLIEEIDEVGINIVEAPERKRRKFVSGYDSWYDQAVFLERQILIEQAKSGNVEAKRRLMNEPHNVTMLILSKKKII